MTLLCTSSATYQRHAQRALKGAITSRQPANLIAITTSADPKPGHMQHQYYKEQERQRQRASRKAEWGEYAHHGSGAAVVEQQLLAGLLAAALAYNLV